jgi:hypothetical protein
MANKKATYSVETKIDTGKAAADAKRLAAIFRSELSKISVGTATKGSGGGSNNVVAAAKQAQAQQTADLKAQTAARIAVARAEAQERIQSARAGVSQIAEAEKRTTAQFKAELAERTRAQKAAEKAAKTPTGGGVRGQIISGIGGAIAGAISVQALRQVIQTGAELAQLRTETLRAAKGFEILSGGAQVAESRIRAVQEAAGGTISRLDATRIATQAVSLNLATTTEQFSRLTEAARVTALISPVIHDVSTAISELGLAAANLSFRRLDQLGLSVTEVKKGMAELQAANAGMSDSEAFLQASVDALINKGGAILDTAEAGASGLEKLNVAVSNLKANLATGWVGTAFDNSFEQISQLLNSSGVAAGNTDFQSQMMAAQELMRNLKNQGNFLNSLGDATGANKIADLTGLSKPGDSYKEEAGQVQLLISALELVNAEENKLLPGIEGYRKAVSDIVQMAAARGEISEEEVKTLQTTIGLTRELISMGVSVDTSAADAAAAAQAAEEARLLTITELVAGYEDEAAAVYAYAKALSEVEGITPQDLSAKVENKIKFTNAGEGLAKGAIGGADALVERFGLAQAKTIIEGQLAEITNAITTWEAQGISGLDLDLNISALESQLAAQVDGIIAQADRLREGANFDTAVGQINQSLAQLNSGAFDSIDGISAVRDELISLSESLGYAGVATDEQAQRIAYLAAIAYAATDSTSALGQVQAILGVEFLNTNAYAAALVNEIAILDAAQATGQINAIQHASGLSVLTGEIYNAANAAGVAAGPLANLLALRNALASSAAGGMSSPSGIRGVQSANSAIQRQQAIAGLARRDQLRDQQADAAKQAAKGFKGAASSAAKDFNAAAKSTRQAFENAAKTLESELRKIPGLFGISDVTQEQLDLAAAGGEVNRPDDYVHRLRDEVKNGKDWEGVSIQGARQALERIGVTVGGTNEAILAQFEEAWSNSSLFADKANLDLINKDAVQQQLQIQDKIKQGQKNILDMFGATVDGVMAGIAAGDPNATGLVANELEGSDDKAIQEMAKGLRDKNQAMIEKVLSLAIAEPMETGGGGGGASTGGFDIPETPIFDPAEFYDSAVAPFVDAGAQLSDPAFFAGFDAFGKKVDEWKAGIGASMPMSAGMFGPASLPPLAAAGSAGAVAGPALTVDPASATAYMTALAAEFAKSENTTILADTGKGMGQVLGVSMAQADNSIQAAGYVLNLGAEFMKSANTDMLATVGRGLAQVLGVSMAQVDNASQATGYVQALQTAFYAQNNLEIARKIGVSIQATIAGGIIDNSTGTNAAAASMYMANLAASFGTPEVGAIPIAIGDTLAFLVNAGFNEHVGADKSAKFMAETSTQFGTITDNLIAVGDMSAYWVGTGFTDHDFSGLADGMIADLKAAFGSDATVASLVSLGGSLVSPIFQGFKNSVAFNPWLQTIVDEVVSQALDAQATATADAQNATVVTGAGVQR